MKKTIYILMSLTIIFSISYAKPKGLEPLHMRPIGAGFWDAGLPESAHTAWRSTVLIQFTRVPALGETKIKVSTGSGIILAVDRQRQVALIVTSNHSLDRSIMRLYYCEVNFPRQAKKEKYCQTRKVSVVMAQTHKDLIYISVKYPPKAQPIAASLKAVDNKQTPPGYIISIGYPFLQLRRKTDWNIPRPKNYKKIIKRYSLGKLLTESLNKNGVYLLAHNADLLKGNSGGPLVAPDGHIIGINTGIFNSAAAKTSRGSVYAYCPGSANRFYFAVSSSEVLDDIEYIKKNKLW
jgi:hypothetical protein